MNFTKIAYKNEPWRDIVIQDIGKMPENPIFVLAGRFKVFRLKVFSQNDFGKENVMFLIEGEKVLDEKCIITLEIEQCYNMVVNVKLKRSLPFDGELCCLLKMALLVRLRNLNAYYFSARILKEQK